ncbi:hypothetical protein COV61_01405 [Candidatus Micrarchaeota archaeon CG11_big_fil_rev_8_21_14_0_20_47_5]|nr:MAG: hypothetical protein AUJ17_03315 [Candidatus Micrarchaeota archaeon CG1_02_47_40]PIN84019.1 MAG: hypothetical protein COV61_01405 [Candidatus Micrarchaeota archaeon CG11_big_fil_rev_8_21_14_0_20_47_5]
MRTLKKERIARQKEGVVITPDFAAARHMMESKGTYESQISEMTAFVELAKLNGELVRGLKKEEKAELQDVLKKAATEGESAVSRKSLIMHAREKLSALILAVVSFFTKNRKARLTKKGKEALGQLKDLAAILSIDANDGEGFIGFETAFGKAYYDILSASHAVSRYGIREDGSYVEGYRRAIEGFVESVT